MFGILGRFTLLVLELDLGLEESSQSPPFYSCQTRGIEERVEYRTVHRECIS